MPMLALFEFGTYKVVRRQFGFGVKIPEKKFDETSLHNRISLI
jgi:hypothetical protein